jgi:hypothetical protein
VNDPVITTSPTLTKIVPALLLAKKNMGPLLKNAVNPHFRNKYADLGASLDVVEPALQAQGILMMQGPGGDGETVSVETMLVHESGEFIRSLLSMKPAKQNNPQDAGSAITYMRRYSLQGLFALAAEDDDGNAASGKAKERAPERPAFQPTVVPPRETNGIDPNALLAEALKAKVIPRPDRILFKEWARTKVAGCKDIADGSPLTPAHLSAIKAHLDEMAELA